MGEKRVKAPHEIMECKRANPFLSTLCPMFAKKKFVELAINHNMAINLEARVLRAKYEKGEYPHQGWEIEAKEDAEEDVNHVRHRVFSSFCWIVVISTIAIAFGFMTGVLHMSLSLDIAKCLTFTGTFLAAWATLFELGGALATWKGEALYEKVYPIIFQLLFCLAFT